MKYDHTTDPAELFRWCAMFCAENETWPVFSTWLKAMAVTEHGEAIAVSLELNDLRQMVLDTFPDERLRSVTL